MRGHRGDELTGLQPNGLSWLRSLVIAEAPSVGVAIEFNGKRLLLGGAEAISTCVTLPPGDKAARVRTVMSGIVVLCNVF